MLRIYATGRGSPFRNILAAAMALLLLPVLLLAVGSMLAAGLFFGAVAILMGGFFWGSILREKFGKRGKKAPDVVVDGVLEGEILPPLSGRRDG